jgi:hypothetical protein
VMKAFEPGFYCGLDTERNIAVKFHRQDVVKSERVKDQDSTVSGDGTSSAS